MTVKVAKLVKMAEQITANMSYTGDTELIAGKVADHLDRFWDPRMKDAISAYATDQNSQLSETLRLAITRLKN